MSVITVSLDGDLLLNIQLLDVAEVPKYIAPINVTKLISDSFKLTSLELAPAPMLPYIHAACELSNTIAAHGIHREWSAEDILNKTMEMVEVCMNEYVCTALTLNEIVGTIH